MIQLPEGTALQMELRRHHHKGRIPLAKACGGLLKRLVGRGKAS